MALPPLQSLLDLLPENTTGAISAIDHQSVVTALYNGIDDLVASSGGGAIPFGAVIPFSGETVPGGYLECDGSAVSRTTFAELFAVIGEIYGPGDGATTFNLPDYRGLFLRGQDKGAGIDPDAATRIDRGDGTGGDVIGSKQADEFKTHTHKAGLLIEGGIVGVYGSTFDDTPGSGAAIAATSAGSQTQAPTSSVGLAETRPINIYTKLIIRAATITRNTFETPEQLVAAGTMGAVPHNMVGAPSRFQTFVRCKVDQLGYVAGDEIPIASADQGAINSSGVGLYGDFLIVNFKVAAGGIAVINFTDGTSNVVADTHWALFVRVEV